MTRPRLLAVLVLAVALLRSAPAKAEEADEGFPLEAALALAETHPILRAASAAIRIAEGNAITAGHWTNPVVEASYWQALMRSSYDRVGTPTVTVGQFVELAGTPAARRRSAVAEARAAQADRDGVARGLEWTVREAFVRLAASHERRRILADTRSDLERASTIVRARVGSGMAPRYDGSRMELALEQAAADAAAAEADIARARGAFDVAVGPRAAELRGAPRIALLEVPPPPPLAAALDAARRRRPDVVAARHRADAASIDVDVAKRSVFPGIGVRVGVGFGQAPGQLDVGGGVIVPLPVVERGQGSVRAAEARAEETRQLTDALVTAATQRVRAAHAEYEKRIEGLARFRTQTASATDGMRAEAEAGYREAKLSVLELVDAYLSVRDARLRLVQLAEEAQLARVAFGLATATPSR